MNATTDLMTDFLAALEHIAKLGQEVAALEKQTVEQEVEAFSKIVTKMLPVMPYIDYKIPVEYYFSGHEFHKTMKDYLPEKGVVLVDTFGQEYTDRDTRGRYTGTQLVLTRSGKLFKLTRSGRWSRWQGEPSSWTAEVKEITPEQAVRQYGLSNIVEGLVTDIKNAVKENEKKKQILNGRLQLLEQVKALLP